MSRFAISSPIAGRPARKRRGPSWWLALVLLALAALYAWLYAVLGPREAPTVERRFLTYPVIFTLYFLTVWAVYRRGAVSRPAARADLVLIVVGAALLRLIILTGVPPSNPDLGRHLWEGRVLLEGLNPYAAPPEAEVYDPIREQLKAEGDDLYSGYWLKYKDVRSVYGPIATLLFAIPHLLPVDPYVSLRVIMTCFDLGTVFLLMGMAGTLGRPRTLVVVYAWSPICLNGFADRGQMDAPMVFLVVLAAWLVLRGRPVLAGVAFGGAILTKLSPLLLLVPLLRVAGPRLGVAFVVTAIAGILPFAGAGLEGLQGFAEFAGRWHENDSLFSLIALAATPLGEMGNAVARAAVSLAALAYAAWRALRLDRSDHLGLVHCLASVSAAVILLSPVTFPWYGTVMLAFLCFRPRASLLALAVVPMFWYLKFLQPDAGFPWRLLLEAQKRHQVWRIPAYATVAVLFLRDALLARRRRRFKDDGEPAAPN